LAISFGVKKMVQKMCRRHDSSHDLDTRDLDRRDRESESAAR